MSLELLSKNSYQQITNDNLIIKNDEENEYIFLSSNDSIQVDRLKGVLSLQRNSRWISCYFNLLATIIGAGILGLPYAFSQSGWILGFTLITLFALSSGFSLHLLAICALKSKQPSSFYHVAEAAIPQASWLIDFAVAIKCFGVASSYLVVIGDLMPTAMTELGVGGVWSLRSTWIWLGFLFVAPLSSVSSLDKLKYTSALSVLFIVFVAAVVVQHAAASTGSAPASAPAPRGSFLAQLSVFIFAYTCQQNIFSVVNEMRRPSRLRTDSAIAAAIASAWAIYVAVAAAGYATFGSAVQSDLLKCYQVSPLITACRIGVSIIVACHYPLQANPARNCILSIWQHFSPGVADPAEQEGEDSRIEPLPVDPRRYWTVTAAFLLPSLLLALMLTDLGVVLAVVGATGSALLSLVLPGLFYCAMHHEPHATSSLGALWKWRAARLQCCAGLVLVPLCLACILFRQRIGHSA